MATKMQENHKDWKNSQMESKNMLDGGKMKHGIHYEETYAPVVSWGATRFFLTLEPQLTIGTPDN